MDCNKEKATRAKEVAENMFTKRDIFGAMRFALEARNLFPALEGIIPMIVTFNVYISAMNKIDGETEWYGVLRVDPLADDDTLRKQYRRLARMLHPDKNKSIGAEGAFNLVSQAWTILSDNAKRVAYNEKIDAVVCTLSTECVDPPEQTGACKIQKETAAEDACKIAQTLQPNRFWTICPRCKSRYKCSRAHFNRRLVCLICHEPFFPAEIDRPAWDISRFVAPRRFLTNRQAISQKALGKSPLPRTSGASSAAQAANGAQQAHEKVKRKRKEEHKWEEGFLGVLHVAKKGYFSPAQVSKALEDLTLSTHGEAHENPLDARVGMGEASMTCKSRQGDFECCDISGVDDNFIAIGAYRAELQNRRMKLDIEEISRKLEELKPDTDDSQTENEAGEEYVRNVDTCQDNIGKSEDRMSGSQATKPFAGTTMAEMVAANLGKMSIDVPDTSVKEAADEDKKEANVEELINDMGKPGEEKKGNDKVSRE